MTNTENINYLYWKFIDTMSNPKYVFQKIAMHLYNKAAKMFRCGVEESFISLAEVWQAVNSWRNEREFTKI